MNNFKDMVVNIFENKSKEIMVLSSLMMMCAMVWTMAILIMPPKTNEASFFLDSEYEIIDDDFVALGLWADNEENDVTLCPYSDVYDHWAKDAILEMTRMQVMNPITDTEFFPNNKVTRADFVTTLGRLENVDITNLKVKSYNDVKSDKYYAPYVAWAEENSISANEKNRKFRPEENITREEMATMLCKYLLYSKRAILIGGNDFSDKAKISSWALDYVSLISGSGYMSGRPDGTFDPKAGVTRAELATLLMRLKNDFNL